jgi:hypothetical protein
MQAPRYAEATGQDYTEADYIFCLGLSNTYQLEGAMRADHEKVKRDPKSN